MKLWLDDLRVAPPGWTRAVNMAEAQKLVEEHQIEEMSLDHDLGAMPPCYECQFGADACDMGVDSCRCDCHRQLQPTGYDFCKWMAETGRWPSTKPRIHSQNPVGRQNMQAVIDRYWHSPLH
jgi:hypothetical protein